MLTPYQSDLLLDVFEQCQIVTKLRSLKNDAEGIPQGADGAFTDEEMRDVTGLYDRACEKLGDIYGDAEVHGVPIELLRQVAERYLPEELQLTAVAID